MTTVSSVGTYDYVHGAANQPNRRIQFCRFGDQIQADVFVLNQKGELANRIATVFGDKIYVHMRGAESLKRKRESEEQIYSLFQSEDSRSSSSQSQDSQPSKRRRSVLKRTERQEIRVPPGLISFIRKKAEQQSQEDLSSQKPLDKLSQVEQDEIIQSLSDRRITINWASQEESENGEIICAIEIFDHSIGIDAATGE